MRSIGILKKLFLLATFLMSGSSWSQVATLVELTGAAQAIPAVGTPRDLRQGDSLNQGETIVTKAMSSAAIRFEDGQLVALTQNSRLAISTYTYNKMEPSKSSILLSLLDGGMRAVTGLIGKAKPENVTYKAANATIGIRGTDLTVSTVAGDNLTISVNSGVISFSYKGQSATITAGNGAILQNGKLTQGTIDQIKAQVASDPNLSSLKSLMQDNNYEASMRTLIQLTQQTAQRDAATTTSNRPLGSTGSTSSTGSGGGAPSGR